MSALNKNLSQKAREVVALMTLEEKASLCSGKDCWTTKPLSRLGLESIVMMDGPHGLRKQIGEGDNLGIGDSIPSVCFPTASGIACSFDRDLIYEVGKAIGEECLQEGVSIILGPGVNQKRSPLCGRNFEYYSEDPIVSGELAASMINGVQSTGIGTSLKHFAANNQEQRRMTIDAIVDERTLREMYLKSFEIAVKKGKPDTVMCSYNKLNGVYCSENKYLLTKILREEWGFQGAVISDWGAVNDRPFGVQAGLDLEMPGNDGYNDAKVMEAVRQGSLPIEALDQVASRVTELILKGMEAKKENYKYNVEKHHQLAVRAAEESAVLLKNEDNLLPGNVLQKSAVIGSFAKAPRYQGAGSSRLNPIRVDNAWEELLNMGLNPSYAKGYQEDSVIRKKNQRKRSRVIEEELIKEACKCAKGMDIVYIFAGLTEGYESEGFDRTTLSLPSAQNRLIEAVSEINHNVVVILSGGAPMELPWIDQVKAVLLGYLGGEGAGKAIAHLLLGSSVPCGKLAESWPIRLEDVPSYHYFPGGRQTVEHREGIYIGYRYYEKAGIPVQFPFGHGLSYTDYEYTQIKLDRLECEHKEKINLTFRITNQGERKAKETTFVFVSHESTEVFLANKELIEFVKVELLPGETKELTITIDTSSIGYYNTKSKEWYAKDGEYILSVGGASDQCVLKTSFHMTSPKQLQPDLREQAPTYYTVALSKNQLEIPQQEYESLYGKKPPVSNPIPSRPYTKNNTLEDVKHTLVGKIILWYANRVVHKATKESKEQKGMMAATVREMPFFAMVTSGEGMISETMMYGIIDLLNGHYLRGIGKLLK